MPTWCGTLTSQVPDEVLQHHLPVGFDVGAVHVRVEEDDREGQDENGVRVMELLDHVRVTHTVPLAVVGGMPRHTMETPEWKSKASLPQLCT